MYSIQIIIRVIIIITIIIIIIIIIQIPTKLAASSSSSSWMRTNMLKLNSDKTEVTLFTSKHNGCNLKS